jgi:carbonic anhydrase/acetyltransferase-like protein (isoleucine patch superfamily)
LIHAYLGRVPAIGEGVHLVESAEIIGDVTIGRDSSVWYNAVIRGDVNVIRIGERTNIQDGCLLHVIGDTHPLTIGSDVTVGHGAILHGCTIGNSCLIGMGSIVLDGATVGDRSLVAAGSLVRMNEVIPPGVLAAGSPAQVVRPLTPEETASLAQSALNYMATVRDYRGQ